jgi:SAM-dependent methyltransferase
VAPAALRQGSIFIQRLRGVIRRYGVVGAGRHMLHLVVAWPDRRRQRRIDDEYDRSHAVDTGGIVRLQTLDIGSENRDLGVRYEATNPEWFRELVGSLPINYGEFVFVDFGSGKGRALMLASEFPFERIVGVEFSPELTKVARRNLERFRSERQQCRAFEVVCTDAVDYEIPQAPTVLYFYNPFRAPVLRRVLSGVRASLEAAPRPTYAVVTGDAPLAVFEEAGFEPVRIPLAAGSSDRGERVFAWPAA